MANLATQADLEDYLGRERDSLSVLAADRGLSVATSKITSYLGFDPAYTADDVELIRTRRGTRRFLLSVPKVSTVTLIEYKTWALWLPIDSSVYTWDPDGGVQFLWTLMLAFTFTDTVELRVTYNHGWSPIPEDMSNVCCDLAAVVMSSEPGVTGEALGGVRGYKVTYAPRDGLSADHKAVLAQYRQPPIA